MFDSILEGSSESIFKFHNILSKAECLSMKETKNTLFILFVGGRLVYTLLLGALIVKCAIWVVENHTNHRLTLPSPQLGNQEYISK